MTKYEKNYLYIVLLAVSVMTLSAALPILASANIPNHSFEEFDETTWQCDDKCTAGNVFDYYVYTTDLERQPPDGIWYLYIFHEAGVYQNVTVPTDAGSLTFGYYNTEDDTGAAIYDGVFTLTLTDVETGEVYVQETFSDQADNWESGSVEIPAAALGRTAQLYLSNVNGFSRIDNFVFSPSSSTHATVKVRVLSHSGDPVKDAKVYIKKNGTKVSLLNLSTNETVTSFVTNKKGRVKHFEILQDLDGGKVKLCVKKNKIEECGKISPAAGMETAYDVNFSSKKVSAIPQR